MNNTLQKIQLVTNIESAIIALVTLLKLQGILTSDRLVEVIFLIYFITRLVQSYFNYKLLRKQ